MTITETAPALPRPAPGAPRSPLSFGRLVWLELRRSPMPLVLPLIAALFWFDSYRPSAPLPPLWVDRTFYAMGQGHTLVDFGPVVCGMAAWISSRDGRRGMADLIGTSALPRWAARLATWAATVCWAVGGYLAFVAALYVVMARSATWGGPPWWPVAVGAAGVAAFASAGFAAGAFFASRFAAPLAAFGGFVAMLTSSQTGFSHDSGWAQVLPTDSNGNYGFDSGVFYPYLPDLPMARVMLLGGLTLVAVGLLGLPAGAGGRLARRLAAGVTALGVVAAGVGVGLAASARLGPHGLFIPALHDAASDRPLPYTPVCGQAVITICLHPAYRQLLPSVTRAMRPELAETAGLPGAPTRAVEVAAIYGAGFAGQGVGEDTLTGRPPVLHLDIGDWALPGAFGATGTAFADQARLLYAHAFVGAGDHPGTLAQQAVQAALMAGAGVPLKAQPRLLLQWSVWTTRAAPVPLASPLYTAARRFAAAPSALRHQWLEGHLGALRDGQLSLGQLP